MTGLVKWFSDAKGYGFVVTDDDPERDIFVHYSAIGGEGYKTLFEGQAVEFALADGAKGPFAQNVIKLDVVPGTIEAAPPRRRAAALDPELRVAA